MTFQFARIVTTNYDTQHASLLRGLLLGLVFDQVYFWLTVESTNCLFDLEQAGGSSDRSCFVQLIPLAAPSFSVWMNSFESIVSLIRRFLPLTPSTFLPFLWIFVILRISSEKSVLLTYRNEREWRIVCLIASLFKCKCIQFTSCLLLLIDQIFKYAIALTIRTQLSWFLFVCNEQHLHFIQTSKVYETPTDS